MSVKRTSRLLKLLIMLQSESHASPEYISERLNICRRTIYRDIQSLVEAGIPCYFDHSANQYRVSKSFFMPPPNFTEREAFSLLLIARKAGQMLAVPLRPYLNNAAIKIENLLPPNLKEHCRRKLKDISISGVPKTPSNTLDNKFIKLQEAIQNKRILNMSYYNKLEQKSITCNFSPLHLAYTNAWYVIGKINLDRGTRTIKLESIENIESTGKCFLESEKFDPTEYFGRAWSALPEGRLYNISLKFSPEIAKEITAVQWHSTQNSAMQDDGSVIIEFRVDGLDEISSWIIGFGDKVQVIRPQILREKIRNIAANMVKHHEESANSELFMQRTI